MCKVPVPSLHLKPGFLPCPILGVPPLRRPLSHSPKFLSHWIGCLHPVSPDIDLCRWLLCLDMCELPEVAGAWLSSSARSRASDVHRALRRSSRCSGPGEGGLPRHRAWVERTTDSWLGKLDHGQLPSGPHSPAVACAVSVQTRVTAEQQGYCRMRQGGDNGLATYAPVAAEATRRQERP